ncbi:MAG: hypothetical protein O7I93_02700 [Gemmatimonadetes bacterium]|nr:hypothetical protein [Gemmatimonadota bacterium]
MNHRQIIPSIAIVTLALAIPTASAAQRFTGRVDIVTHTLGMQELLELVGENVTTVMDLPVDAIRTAPGVRTEAYLAKVRGSVVYIVTDEGDVRVDYETGRFAMYDPANDVHATWTADELEEWMASMMGGGAGAGADMASTMALMRGAMGVTEEEPEGPYPLDREDDCGTWWAGKMGTVDFEGNPMQPGWILHMCVTQDHPDAWQSYKAMTDASSQLNPMNSEDAEDRMESAILEHGMPTITKLLKKGGDMSPSLEFAVTVVKVTPGPVSAEEVEPKGREVTLQEFMDLRMRGMR